MFTRLDRATTLFLMIISICTNKGSNAFHGKMLLELNLSEKTKN